MYEVKSYTQDYSVTILLIITIILGILIIPFQKVFSVETICDFQHRECFTKKGYPACYSKLDIDKYYEFLERGENELAESIISNKKKCVILEGNEKAYMQSKGSGKVKFGIRGKDKTFWALREALVSKN